MIYNLPIRDIVPISALFSASVMLTLIIKDDDDKSLSFALLDENAILLVKQSIKTCHKPNRYDTVAHYIVLLQLLKMKFVSFSAIKKQFNLWKPINKTKL